MRKHQPKQVGAFFRRWLSQYRVRESLTEFHNRGYPVQIQTKCLTGYPGQVNQKKEIESMRQNESNLTMTTDVAVTTNTTNMEEKGMKGFFKNMKKKVLPAVAGQQLAVVSEVKGTTTDPVYKTMELLPIGPVMMIDTPGIDDEGALGTVNLDYRSLFLHFENNSLFYQVALLQDLKKDFLETQSKCRERTTDNIRMNFMKWLLDGILRILAPLC